MWHVACAQNEKRKGRRLSVDVVSWEPQSFSVLLSQWKRLTATSLSLFHYLPRRQAGILPWQNPSFVSLSLQGEREEEGETGEAIFHEKKPS